MPLQTPCVLSIGREAGLRSKPLTDGQNISLAVFEPRRLCTACSGDAVHGRDPVHVVFLEDHASRLQFADFRRHVLNRPKMPCWLSTCPLPLTGRTFCS